MLLRSVFIADPSLSALWDASHRPFFDAVVFLQAWSVLLIGKPNFALIISNIIKFHQDGEYGDASTKMCSSTDQLGSRRDQKY
jgi:hypothetical protein